MDSCKLVCLSSSLKILSPPLQELPDSSQHCQEDETGDRQTGSWRGGTDTFVQVRLCVCSVSAKSLMYLVVHVWQSWVEIDHDSVACFTARTPVKGGAQLFVHLRSVYEPHP